MISTVPDATRNPAATLLAAVTPVSEAEPNAPLHRVGGSFASYFSAFPAAYWAHWTVLEDVELRLRTRGTGTVRIVASDSTGASRTIERVQVSGETSTMRTLPLAGFDEGGWYWFEMEGEAEVASGGWWAPASARPERLLRPSVVITTLDRESYLLPVLASIGADPEILGLLDRIIVVDHGSRRVAEAAGFEAATADLGGRLHLVEQSNLGGSGGFSRGMLEAVDAGSSAVILLDDDVAVDPESLRRLIRFAEFSRVPTIVGGHMLDMASRTRLHAMAEGIRPDTFFWHTRGPSGHDLAEAGLAVTPWLHRRRDADYNGWWMCLIPASALTDIGLAMPFFIKWDDAEYGVRAAAAGIPTVSLPGAAIWHVSWEHKDDTVGWQGYFHARNRLISALLHSSERRGGRIVPAHLSLSVRYLFALEYGAQLIRNQALRDVLEGPAHLHETLATRIGDVRLLLGSTRSGTAIPRAEWLQLTSTTPRSPRRASRDDHPGAVSILLRSFPILLRNLLPTRTAHRPRVWLALADARWWNVGRYDSVLTESPDEAGGRWLVRDRSLAWGLFVDAWRLSRRLRREWPDLATRYRDAAEDLTSLATWRRTTSGRD